MRFRLSDPFQTSHILATVGQTEISSTKLPNISNIAERQLNIEMRINFMYLTNRENRKTMSDLAQGIAPSQLTIFDIGSR